MRKSEGVLRRPVLARISCRARAFMLRSEGFSGSAARKWVSKVDESLASNNGYSKSEKKRAHKWGFFPEEADRWGITEANKDSLLSEREYLYLHPMNGKYDKWLHDRISALNVFSGFKEFFEPCHFHIIRRTGVPFFIPLTEKGKAVSPDVAGLHAFLSQHGTMMLTGASWSNDACWDIAALPNTEGTLCFSLDGIRLTEDEFNLWLSDATRKRVLVLAERVVARDFFDEISPGAEASLRVCMINDSGVSPHVGQAIIQLSYPEVIFGSHSAEYDSSEAEWADADESAESVGGEDGSRDLPISTKPKKTLVFKHYSEADPATGEFCGLKYGQGGTLVKVNRARSCEAEFKGSIPHWEDIRGTLEAMCRLVPQIEFAEFKVKVGKGGFTIVSITSLPKYNQVIPFADELNAFFMRRYELKHESFNRLTQRRKRFLHNLALKIRRTFAAVVAPKGLVPYQSTRWIGDVCRDLFSKNGLPLKTKLWAYRNGFLSYRIDQYGITPENRGDFISDFEYRWLRHINTKYKYWLEDKITLRYVAPEFTECFPGYYYYTSLKGGKNLIIPMMDLPSGFEATYEDILRLAKEKKVLALKPDEGSHGEGFYRLSWEDDHFELNGNPATDEEVCSILQNPNNQYLITEYIQMHPQLKEIYPGSVNTIRVTVYKKDGRTPEIGNAYMRVGSSRTGYVDNLAAGGIGVAVDVETGCYGNAQVLDGVNQGNLVPCPVHPDTGVVIEGVLPNWEYAKTRILDIARAIPQLEYFGFDVAITSDGIKLPEINRYPDFPRIDKVTPELIDYLLYKLECKKRVYGYHERSCGKLLSLPKR